MSLLLTFRGPSGQVYGRIFEEVVGGGQECTHAGSHSWLSFELPENCQPLCLPQAQVPHRIFD